MNVAIIPLKRLRDAKSRLAPSTNYEEREAIIVECLSRVLNAVRGVHLIDVIAIATPEQVLVRQFGTVWLPDGGSLNATLRGGLTWASHLAARSALILPADLPYVTAADIQAVFAIHANATGLTLAPTRDGGTGALLLTPPGAMEPQFGIDSARRHMELARARRLAFREVRVPGLENDLDTPADLIRFRAHKEKGHTDGMAPFDVSLETGR